LKFLISNKKKSIYSSEESPTSENDDYRILVDVDEYSLEDFQDHRVLQNKDLTYDI